MCSLQNPQCHMVVTGKYGVYFWKLLEQLIHSALSAQWGPITCNDATTLDGAASSGECILPAKLALARDRPGQRASDEPDLLIPLRQQMRCSQATASPVITENHRQVTRNP